MAEILHDLNNELQNAIDIAEVELRLADARVESLEEQLADVRGRFDRLAGMRAQYANLIAQTQNRTDLLETARRTLADARAAQAAARTASRIARIGPPDTGTRPVGPSRAMIVVIGVIGGLIFRPETSLTREIRRALSCSSSSTTTHQAFVLLPVYRNLSPHLSYLRTVVKK